MSSISLDGDVGGGGEQDGGGRRLSVMLRKRIIYSGLARGPADWVRHGQRRRSKEVHSMSSGEASINSRMASGVTACVSSFISEVKNLA